MDALENTMPANEYTLFTDNGYFTIRPLYDFRIGKFLRSDYREVIYEDNEMETSGGMKHDWGIIHCMSICDVLENFAGGNTATSEQYKDLRASTHSRDKDDYLPLSPWLQTRPSLAGYEADRPDAVEVDGA